MSFSFCKIAHKNKCYSEAAWTVTSSWICYGREGKPTSERKQFEISHDSNEFCSNIVSIIPYGEFLYCLSEMMVFYWLHCWGLWRGGLEEAAREPRRTRERERPRQTGRVACCEGPPGAEISQDQQGRRAASEVDRIWEASAGSCRFLVLILNLLSFIDASRIVRRDLVVRGKVPFQRIHFRADLLDQFSRSGRCCVRLTQSV